jgi:hypothetical protein
MAVRIGKENRVAKAKKPASSTKKSTPAAKPSTSAPGATKAELAGQEKTASVSEARGKDGSDTTASVKSDTAPADAETSPAKTSAAKASSSDAASARKTDSTKVSTSGEPATQADAGKPSGTEKPETGAAKPDADPAKGRASQTAASAATSKAATSSTSSVASGGKSVPATSGKASDGSQSLSGDKDAPTPPSKAAATASAMPKATSETRGTSTPRSDPPKQRSIFLPLVFGGALAAVGGFLVSEFDLLQLRGPDQSAELRTELTRQQEQIAALQEAAETETAASPDTEALGAVTTELETMRQALADVQARISDLEQRPTSEGEAPSVDLSAYEDRLAALQANVETQRGEIEALLDNARSVEEATADAARAATLQTLMTRLNGAVFSGAPYAEVLSEMQALDVPDLPEVLRTHAETGVVTLANLQTRFPDAARAALAAARTGEASGSDGFTGFLKRQLGARSVAPREGSDADAVLSRAEAAVRDGRLGEALSELETLPEAAMTAMQEWRADANARHDATEAADALSQRLTAN